MGRMTIQEAKEHIINEDLSFDQAIDFIIDNDIGVDYLFSFDSMKDLIKHELDEDNINMVQHLVNAIWNDTSKGDEWWVYDRSMGILETPYAIGDVQELLEYLDTLG